MNDRHERAVAQPDRYITHLLLIDLEDPSKPARLIPSHLHASGCDRQECETKMSDFKQYRHRRSQIAELRPWQPGDDISGVSISAPDKEAGSPKEGDMIARNPKNHEDQWLVAAQYFADNFEPIFGR